jgi:hypothetical protein
VGFENTVLRGILGPNWEKVTGGWRKSLGCKQELHSTNIIFFDIIHRPVYDSKHDVSETGFCLRLQAKPTHLGPIDTASPYLWMKLCFEIETRLCF